MNIDELRDFYFRQLQGRLGDITSELTRVQHASRRALEARHPSINAYRCENGILIVAELAGVDRSQISLTVEPRRVWLRGRRLAPEPRESDGAVLRVLALEIDHGAFEREIVLSVDVDPDRVQAEQREGFLWICLPLGEGA